ncbi:hypothetical protein UK23_40545 [Lentzea aerocolonigenes]|uniref:Uncharacterized protein n=1 Tax=Lentzea aerocolonigenes TaxID=68170 RepID=A0A0F0GDY1_LENAE|nr:hypothetical protein [Lentzea aerocolonigenes]KJK40105.1 hypothetical protein UK23_40545 [Lentzea aerocolonigenes]
MIGGTRMVRITRKWAVGAALLLATSVGVYALLVDTGIDGPDEIAAALPTVDDMPGYRAHRGAGDVLSDPGTGDDGQAVLTGKPLGNLCFSYQNQNDGWACEGLLGLGVVGFVNDSLARVGSFVLAYQDEASATKAWSAMVRATRAEHEHAEVRDQPHAGDESRSFVLSTGTITVMRFGSVVAQAVSLSEYGFEDRVVPPSAAKDPIEQWVRVLAEKIEDAGG